MAGVLALGLVMSVQAASGQPTAEPPAVVVAGTEERATPTPGVAIASTEPVVEAPVEEAPAPEPAVEVPVPPLPAPEPPAEPDPCREALAWVAAAGLPLPDGVGYHCPSTQFPHQGAACWNGSPCRGRGFIAINMDLLAGTSTAYLRHVVAHEICHILDFQATGRTTEAGADACAAAHGA